METELINWKKNTALFLIGQAITLFGSMLVHYAVMWHITLKTGSGAMITLMTIAGVLPMFLISPFAGVWADHYNKKLIINIADTVVAAVTLVMALLLSMGFEFTGALLICLVARAFGQGVQMPAVNAFIPEIAPKEHLTRVNGISGALQSFIMFASPIASGALLAILPIQILMYIDTVTAAIGIGVLLFFVKSSARLEKSEPKPGAKQYFTEIREGIKYVKGQSFLRKLFIVSAFFNIMSAPVSVMTPLQVARNFGGDIWRLDGFTFNAEARLAVLEAVFFIGLLAGGLIIGVWGGFKNKSRTMALSSFLLGSATIGLGIIGNFWLYLTLMCIIGIAVNLFNPPMMAALQTSVEPTYMGRVFSVLAMSGTLMMPLSMVIWGPLGDVVSIDSLLIVTGMFLFLMGFAFIFDKTLAGTKNK